MRKVTVAELQNILDTLDSGVLSSGSHLPSDGAFCALEALSRVDGGAHTDSPRALAVPDIRPLNDAPWSSNVERTPALLAVTAALSDWASWSTTRRQAFAEYLAIMVVRDIVSALPRLPEYTRALCDGVTTIADAQNAAYAVTYAATSAATSAAAYAARAAARAVASAADAAAAAYAAAAAANAANAADAADAADAAILIRACEIFLEAALFSEGE